ncbi:MAG: SDR family oxidoreductase [Anaerolineales bacterium]|nr:SDR family oxidoreductase [Anaerolineales bacterium]
MSVSNQIADLPLLTGIKLTDKVAIVTGGGSGIGKAAAAVLAHAGCRVVIGEYDAARGTAVADELTAAGFSAVAVQADVSHRADAQRLADTALETYGSIDILANVAGVYPAALVANMDEQEWDRVFGVNTKGVFNCCQAVIPTMMANRRGAIVNIASVDGMQPGIMPGLSGYGNAHYCASKGAVLTFTKSLAAEMAPYNVNVNALSPGWVATETALAGGRFEEGLKQVPLGRGAQPEEIGQMILFLASEAASFMTGANLVFSGGSVMD